MIKLMIILSLLHLITAEGTEVLSRWSAIKKIADRFPKAAIIVGSSTIDYVGCIGVPISERHIIYSTLCHKIHIKKSAVIVNDAVDWDIENSYRFVESSRFFGPHIALLTLKNKIKKNITLYKLSPSFLESSYNLTSFGQRAYCSRNHSIDGLEAGENLLEQNVTRYMECSDTNADPNSVRICRPQSLDIASVENGSPVIDNNYTIYGFIEHECKIINKFHQIAPYFEGIKAMINRDLNHRQFNIKKITQRFLKSAIVITEDDDNGCLGVPISQRHIVYSKLCDKIDPNAQVGSIFVASSNWDANNSYRPVKKRRVFGDSFILLTLENYIEKEIPIYQLPSVELQSDAELISFGYTASCYNYGEYSQEGDDPFFRKTVYYDPSGILSPRQYLNNHYLFQYSFYLKMSMGSPIVNGDNNIIYGFAEFECSSFGSFKSIFNYSLPIIEAVLKDLLIN